MFTPVAVSPSNSQSITVVFDTGDPKQAELLGAFRESFGEKYSCSEDLRPPFVFALNLLPGGALPGRGV